MKKTIINHLNQSKISVLIAVSWLTDKDIIKLIAKKAEEGVQFKILLSAHDWNLIRYNDFVNLINTGVVINKRGEKKSGIGNFMHCKFAVIDEKTVINGSYNWTTLGSTNDEKLIIIEDYEKAREFIIDFHRMFKESTGFLKDLKQNEIEPIIKEFEEMENNNLEPSIDGEIKPVENIKEDIIKIEELQKPSLLIPKLINTFENIQDFSFDGLVKIDFEGKLYLSSFIYGYANSTIKVSSNKKDYFSIKINNYILKNALIAGNVDFSILNSRLGGIPDFILKLVLQKRFVSIIGIILVKNNLPYEFTHPRMGEISIVLDKHDNYNLQDEYISLGNKLLKSINIGEKSKADLTNEFKEINWLE